MDTHVRWEQALGGAFGFGLVGAVVAGWPGFWAGAAIAALVSLYRHTS